MRRLLIFSLIGFFLVFSSPAFAQEEEDVLVKPIRGLDTGIFGISPTKAVTSVVNNNYQVFCANEPTTMSPSVSGAYEEYLREIGKMVKLNPTANAGLDEGLLMRTGLIRESKEEETFPDIESYIANSEVPLELLQNEPYWQGVVTADFYKKTSLEDQCELAKLSAENIMNWCEFSTGECAADIMIANSNYKISQLNSALGSVECKDFKSSYYIQELALSNPGLLQGIANVPYYQINTYKPAFLISATEQKPSGEQGNLFEDWVRTFFNWTIRPGDKISVMVILLPTTSMQENPDDDPIQPQELSRQLSTNLIAWEDEKARDEAEKNDRLTRVLAALGNWGQGKRINCLNCNSFRTRGIYTALASYINSENPTCEDIITEVSEDIDSPSNIPQTQASMWKNFVDGITDKISGTFNTQMETGHVPAAELEAKKAEFETFIIAPYADKDTIFHLLASYKDRQNYETQLENLPKQVEFNKVTDVVDTTSESKTFCLPGCVEDSDGDGKKDTECCKSYTVGLSKVNRKISLTGADDHRERSLKVQSKLYPEHEPDGTINVAQKNIRKNIDDTEAFLLGTNLEEELKKSSDKKDGLGKSSESCEEYKNTMVDVPASWNDLLKTIKKVAGNQEDAEMLKGLVELEGKQLIQSLGKGQVKCGEIIVNDCGASQITGTLVPACIETSDNDYDGDGITCDQAAYIKDGDPVPIDAVCNVEGALRWTLEKRGSEDTWLKTIYKEANGGDPSNKQMKYMRAGRNAGVPLKYLVNDGCEGADPIDVGVEFGCNGLNYCRCAVDKFSKL